MKLCTRLAGALALAPEVANDRRLNSIYGNPFLRLVRREVEALVKSKRGENYLKDQQAKTELARIERELKRLNTQIVALEEPKSKLIAGLRR